MTEQKETLSIIPRGEEERAIFVTRLNEYLKLHEIIESAKYSQKDIMTSIAESFIAVNDDVKKAEVNKRVKLLLEEAIKAKATEQLELAEEVLEDYSIVKGKLI